MGMKSFEQDRLHPLASARLVGLTFRCVVGDISIIRVASNPRGTVQLALQRHTQREMVERPQRGPEFLTQRQALARRDKRSVELTAFDVHTRQIGEVHAQRWPPCFSASERDRFAITQQCCVEVAARPCNLREVGAMMPALETY